MLMALACMTPMLPIRATRMSDAHRRAGRRGGGVTSRAKILAARRNGRTGGRPPLNPEAKAERPALWALMTALRALGALPPTMRRHAAGESIGAALLILRPPD